MFSEWLTETQLESTYTDFVAHLHSADVEDVVEPWTLLRQGTDWKAVNHPPFAMPPPEVWDSMVPTLVLIRDHIEPEFGQVEVVSGFRTSEFNAAAGGSSGSRHKFFEAVDLVPSRPTRRKKLHQKLEQFYADNGQESQVGLGLYRNTRFHIDTWKARRW